MRNNLSTVSRSGKILLTLAVAVGCFGVATAVQAAIPAANGTISGCYAKAGGPNQGELRAVDQGSACKPGEAPLSWNQVGQPGPAGPAGPGVSTVAGFVNGNVDTYGKGFTRPEDGHRLVPPRLPEQGVHGLPRRRRVRLGPPRLRADGQRRQQRHPGPWQVDIFVTKPDGQTPTDSAFQFVAAQVSN